MSGVSLNFFVNIPFKDDENLLNGNLFQDLHQEILGHVHVEDFQSTSLISRHWYNITREVEKNESQKIKKFCEFLNENLKEKIETSNLSHNWGTVLTLKEKILNVFKKSEIPELENLLKQYDDVKLPLHCRNLIHLTQIYKRTDVANTELLRNQLVVNFAFAGHFEKALEILNTNSPYNCGHGFIEQIFLVLSKRLEKIHPFTVLKIANKITYLPWQIDLLATLALRLYSKDFHLAKMIIKTLEPDHEVFGKKNLKDLSLGTLDFSKASEYFCSKRPGSWLVRFDANQQNHLLTILMDKIVNVILDDQNVEDFILKNKVLLLETNRIKNL